MAQKNVVDVAALSRIGRQSTYEGKQPNRSMDHFLQFAGSVAVNLFSKAWQTKQAANNTNKEFLSEKSTDLRDLNTTLKSKVQEQFSQIGDILSQGVKDQYGMFNVQIGKTAEQRSQKGVDAQTNAKNRALNIHEDTQNYVLNQKKYNTMVTEGVVVDDKGVPQSAGLGPQNLASELVFSQAYANGVTDQFVIYDENGRMGMNSNIIDLIEGGSNIDNADPKKLKALLEEANKTGEFIPVEDWPLGQVDESSLGNDILTGIDDLTVNNGANYEYNANVHGKNYSNFIKSKLYGTGGERGLSDNQLASYIWGGKGINERPPIEDFVENPTFDVKIDHDGDPNTPKAVFDGSAEWIKREFGEGKTLDNLTRDEMVKYERWKQGAINELKTNMNVRDAGVLSWLEGQFEQYAETGHSDVWSISKNNPANKTLSKYEQQQLDILRNQEPKTVSFEFGTFKAPTTEAQLEDYSVVNQIASGQNIVKIGHDTYEKQGDGKYKLTKSTQRGTVEYIETNKSYTKTQMIQEHGNVYGNIPNNFMFWDDIKWATNMPKDAKEGGYYHDTEKDKYYQFSGGKYIEIYKPKK